MANIKTVLANIRTNFVAELSVKTGWGRNEVLSRYDVAVNKELINHVEEKCSYTNSTVKTVADQ
ncbi:MAG: hypothetical protein M0R68_15310 [Bacteroidetes bacterium]|nr:hypothetical protein [Bacteroidota bacterium]